MERKQAFLMVITIIAVGLVFYFFGTEAQDKTRQGGNYYDAKGNLLGECVYTNVPQKFISITQFYNARGNLVGTCSEYYGPENPGWKGGCDEEALANDIAYRVESGIYQGKIARKYSCIIE